MGFHAFKTVSAAVFGKYVLDLPTQPKSVFLIKISWCNAVHLMGHIYQGRGAHASRVVEALIDRSSVLLLWKGREETSQLGGPTISPWRRGDCLPCRMARDAEALPAPEDRSLQSPLWGRCGAGAEGRRHRLKKILGLNILLSLCNQFGAEWSVDRGYSPCWWHSPDRCCWQTCPCESPSV